ncbi:hypothetical protein [Ramlibacter sp. Leaf400]|uniref:hypothetical protein n=1 Tax=Ramlibacter sp. Leaf400 TaxID=1736365 RepID=UPI0006FA183A|nr:hypothetical protein [Ramlibacter sp. Leaf400]KQT11037.1 hypothetical protein ASG30_09625 [Ramlibacter sp. Leaf400]
MHVDESIEIEAVRDELAMARAEQAEALRRAHHLRAMGSLRDIREAERNVDVLHSRVTSLQFQLRSLRPV